MKKIVLYLVLVMLLSSCGNSQTEKVIQQYKSGQPYKVYVYDGDGNWIREMEYYESGQIKMEGAVANNLRNGAWTSYFPDGKVQSTGDFKDGVRIGKSQVFYENGRLWMDGFYTDDHKCGEWIFYDEQGYETSRVNYGSCD